MQLGFMPGGVPPAGFMAGMAQQGAVQPVLGQPTLMIPLGGGQVLFPGPQMPQAQQQQQQQDQPRDQQQDRDEHMDG
jgi:hypothetical protein